MTDINCVIKSCSRCGNLLPIKEFNRSSKGKNGLDCWCKTCHREYSQNRNYRFMGDLQKDTKICSVCGEIKVAKEFYKNRLCKDGLCSLCKTCSKIWFKENPEKVRGYKAKSRKKNIAKIRISNSRRKARKRKLPRTLTIDEWVYILNYYNHRCAYCGKSEEVAGSLTQDHVMPVAKGGGYTAINIVPACLSCNSYKKDRTPTEAGMVLLKPQPVIQLCLFNNE